MAKLQVTLASLLPGTTVMLGTSVIHVSVGKKMNSDETTTSPTLIHRFPKSTETETPVNNHHREPPEVLPCRKPVLRRYPEYAIATDHNTST